MADMALCRDVKRELEDEDIVPDLGLVVSMGAGKSVAQPTAVPDLNSFLTMNPAELYTYVMAAKNLLNLLTTQITYTDRDVEQRVRFWCKDIKVPYFRFSPSMLELIALDEQNDAEIIGALWQAKAYVVQQEEFVEILISLLESWPEAEKMNESMRQRILEQRHDFQEFLSKILD